MEPLRKKMFARYKNTSFMSLKDGVLVLSARAPISAPSEKEKQLLFEKKEEVLREKGRSDQGALCMICCVQREDRHSLFPVCREAHFFVCQECMLKEAEHQRENTQKLRCPHCQDDNFSVESYEEMLPVSFESPEDFFLKPEEPLTNNLLTNNTNVFIENIAISDTLFIKLLESTNVHTKGRVCVFPGKKQEDCIESDNTYPYGHLTKTYTPIALTPSQFDQTKTEMVLKNTRRNKQSKTRCGCSVFSFCNNPLSNILSVLQIDRGNNMDSLVLFADSEEYVGDILETDNGSICVGRLKELKLGKYGVNILPKLEIDRNNEMESLELYATEKKQIDEVSRECNESICIGKIKRLKLVYCAVNALPKLKTTKKNSLETLDLFAEKGDVAEILEADSRSIWVGEINHMKLRNSAVEVLPKLKIKITSHMESIELSAERLEHVSEILKAEDRSIQLGVVYKTRLEGYAAGILPKLKIEGEDEMDALTISADSEKCISEILKTPDRSICIGKVASLCLKGHAIGILSKTGEGCEVESLELYADEEEHLSAVRKTQDRSIRIGETKSLVLAMFAASTLPKLRIDENCLVESLSISADREEHVAEMLSCEDRSIWPGRIENLKLEKTAISILPKLRIDNETERTELSADKKEHVSMLLRRQNGSVLIQTRQLKLRKYALGILPKLKIDSRIDRLCLCAEKKEYISEALKTNEKSIQLGRVERLTLEEHAISILPRVLIDENNTIGSLNVLGGELEHLEGVLREEDKSIWIGEVKELRLEKTAISIFPKLRTGKELEMEGLALYAKKDRRFRN
ncbi:MAG: uncharacterized protein A8A55_2624 [Amphiamblys sp. WSBS2006]|nr:MAG: uncharacterized protein A8A55_2624 [Amphiamblys sp. WSBS2006]